MSLEQVTGIVVRVGHQTRGGNTTTALLYEVDERICCLMVEETEYWEGCVLSVTNPGDRVTLELDKSGERDRLFSIENHSVGMFAQRQAFRFNGQLR